MNGGDELPDSPVAGMPRVRIHFCELCRYRPLAESIAAAIREELQLPVAIEPGGWGCFRVELDGREIYDRWTSNGWWGRIGFGRAPTPAVILAKLRSFPPPR